MFELIVQFTASFVLAVAFVEITFSIEEGYGDKESASDSV